MYNSSVATSSGVMLLFPNTNGWSSLPFCLSPQKCQKKKNAAVGQKAFLDFGCKV